jgi:hypothetical protein
MKIGIVLGQKVRLAFEIPPIAYVAFAAIGIVSAALIFGGSAPDQTKSVKIGLHEIDFRVDVNRAAKADQLLPTFDERFEGFGVPKPPTNPVLGPIATEQMGRQQDPVKKTVPVVRLVESYFYQIRPKELGAPEDEVELEVVKVTCRWPHQFPPPCYYPQNERWKLPIYRFDGLPNE